MAEVPMQMSPYLSFQGDCEAAFRFYEQCLGGKMGEIFRWAGTPLAGEVPSAWGDKVMHASVTIGEQVLMGADVPADRFSRRDGFSLSLNLGDVAEAERIFRDLAEGGGRATVPLAKTFWATRFGMVTDRFGISWMVNCA